MMMSLITYYVALSMFRALVRLPPRDATRKQLRPPSRRQRNASLLGASAGQGRTSLRRLLARAARAWPVRPGRELHALWRPQSLVMHLPASFFPVDLARRRRVHRGRRRCGGCCESGGGEEEEEWELIAPEELLLGASLAGVLSDRC